MSPPLASDSRKHFLKNSSYLLLPVNLELLDLALHMQQPGVDRWIDLLCSEDIELFDSVLKGKAVLFSGKNTHSYFIFMDFQIFYFI